MKPFHLAIPVHDLKVAQDFYGQLLNCQQGRSSDHWIDYNFFGHQLVVHLDKNISKKTFNAVDGKNVPIPHFGVVLNWNVFQIFSKKLIEKNIDFQIEPYIRFEGLPGEQMTMFFYDPSGNALEFKSFKNIDQLFAT